MACLLIHLLVIPFSFAWIGDSPQPPDPCLSVTHQALCISTFPDQCYEAWLDYILYSGVVIRKNDHNTLAKISPSSIMCSMLFFCLLRSR